MSSPPVSSTPSARATDSATSERAGSAGGIHGKPPPAAMARLYWFERLMELSSNSTPRFVVLGVMRISGGFMKSLGNFRLGKQLANPLHHPALLLGTDEAAVDAAANAIE